MYSKYHNKRTSLDGLTFDSLKEAGRWQELTLLARAGEISGLQRQVPFDLCPDLRTPAGKHVAGIRYVADFVYRDKQGVEIVEDAKGVRTEVYKIKKKLMLWIHGIEIREV